ALQFLPSEGLFLCVPFSSNVLNNSNPSVYLVVLPMRRHVHRVNQSRTHREECHLGFIFLPFSRKCFLDVRPDGFVAIPADYIENRAAHYFFSRRPQPSRVTAAYPQVAKVTAVLRNPDLHILCNKFQL